MKVDKKDGKWYYHDGVSAKDTHQRKGGLTLSLKKCILPTF